MPRELPIKTVFKAVDQITRPVKQMQSRIGRFSDNSIRKLGMMNKRLKSVNQSMTAFGKQAAIAGAAVGAASAVVIRAGMGFEQAITNVGAVGLKTRAEIKPLEDLALKLGKTTEFTATQAANAMEVLARAGFNATQIMQATPAVLSAASASGLEIAEVADHVSNALKGMGLAMNQSGRVADVLALASARTNSTIGSLGESLKNVASTARELNIPLESVVSGVALLQDVGLEASVAGSAFNTMLTKMAAPTPKITQQLRRLGVSFKDSFGNMKPFEIVLGEISAASSKVGGNFNKVAFLADLVGLRGQKAASNLARLFETGKLQELTKELNNARGSAEKMAKIRLDTTEGSFKLLGSAIDGVQQALFGLRSGQIKEAIDNITAFISDNQADIVERINAGVGKLIDNFGLLLDIIKGFAVAVITIKAVTIAIGGLTMAMKALNFVMNMNPWVRFFSIMTTGFAVWAIDTMEALKPIKNFFSELWNTITGIFPAIGELLGLTNQGIQLNTQGGELLAPSPIAQRPTAEGLGLIDRVTSNTQTTENFVTIRDETGRADIQGSNTPFINLLPSGA
jgi:TP901 family phage tail tape measure protein